MQKQANTTPMAPTTTIRFLTLSVSLLSLSSLSTCLTIFAPADIAFKYFHQLPLNLLRYHTLPHAFSLHCLTSLPFGTNIATLIPGFFLTVTTSNHRLSINNVTIHPSPLFDDGYLIIFRIDNFFDHDFRLRRSTTTTIADSGAAASCFPARNRFFSDTEAFSYKEAIGVLRSRGCSVMASFLNMQLLALKDRPESDQLMTVFAPIDEAMVVVGNLSDYSTIRRRYRVSFKILRSDLVTLHEGKLIWIYQRGFLLNVTTESKSFSTDMNGVIPVISPSYISVIGRWTWFIPSHNFSRFLREDLEDMIRLGFQNLHFSLITMVRKTLPNITASLFFIG